jgi:hypothetical protein
MVLPIKLWFLPIFYLFAKGNAIGYCARKVDIFFGGFIMSSGGEPYD